MQQNEENALLKIATSHTTWIHFMNILLSVSTRQKSALFHLYKIQNKTKLIRSHDSNYVFSDVWPGRGSSRFQEFHQILCLG